MQAVELGILDWMQTHLRCEFLDAVLPWISWTANHGEIWILLALVLLLMRRQRQYGAAVACGLVLDLVACNLVLKPLIGRIRPFAVNPDVVLLIAPPGDASFPSGHTAVSFAAVFALEAGAGAGGGDRVFQAIPLRALAQRCTGRRNSGRRCGLGGGQAGGRYRETGEVPDLIPDKFSLHILA